MKKLILASILAWLISQVYAQNMTAKEACPDPAFAYPVTCLSIHSPSNNANSNDTVAYKYGCLKSQEQALNSASFCSVNQTLSQVNVTFQCITTYTPITCDSTSADPIVSCAPSYNLTQYGSCPGRTCPIVYQSSGALFNYTNTCGTTCYGPKYQCCPGYLNVIGSNALCLNPGAISASPSATASPGTAPKSTSGGGQRHSITVFGLWSFIVILYHVFNPTPVSASSKTQPQQTPKMLKQDEEEDAPRRSWLNPQLAKFTLFFFIALLLINAFAMVIVSTSTYEGTGPFPGQSDLFPQDLLLALTVLGALNFARGASICFYSLRMSSMGLIISSILAIVYVAVHLVLGFIASNTIADASTTWITLSDDKRTSIAAIIGCGYDQAHDCITIATSIRQNEIFIVAIWMILGAVIHAAAGVSAMIVYYAIRTHAYDMDEEIIQEYGMNESGRDPSWDQQRPPSVIETSRSDTRESSNTEGKAVEVGVIDDLKRLADGRQAVGL
ncbi:hypothetical protein SmJEL517_g04629 [Synchytrium microbalum]|uniref:TRP C-terminal domain-containing protein n=1 Tax=Synchytrium microbalum TaxID=1806994 RepID=A0A507BYK3_9FUNG|nr:uncharacterized protein SmJEL517_g04629 [Synchytrium microbalum]TPX32208.1 hypothetical protein SmJEL517_g04629 [Synchytrium microbalum]